MKLHAQMVLFAFIASIYPQGFVVGQENQPQTTSQLLKKFSSSELGSRVEEELIRRSKASATIRSHSYRIQDPASSPLWSNTKVVTDGRQWKALVVDSASQQVQEKEGSRTSSIKYERIINNNDFLIIKLTDPLRVFTTTIEVTEKTRAKTVTALGDWVTAFGYIESGELYWIPTIIKQAQNAKVETDRYSGATVYKITTENPFGTFSFWIDPTKSFSIVKVHYLRSVGNRFDDLGSQATTKNSTISRIEFDAQISYSVSNLGWVPLSDKIERHHRGTAAGKLTKTDTINEIVFEDFVVDPRIDDDVFMPSVGPLEGTSVSNLLEPNVKLVIKNGKVTKALQQETIDNLNTARLQKVLPGARDSHHMILITIGLIAIFGMVWFVISKYRTHNKT